jgi:glycosyltransferase involved in cell wall biosynthesis
MSTAPDAVVLIATYNRADRLAETLEVLALSDVPRGLRWEVIVIDNNSTDHTRDVVVSRQSAYPVPLHYRAELRQGRSAALNAGIAATTAPLVLFLDDDVRVDRAWVAAAVAALQAGSDYVGGPVRPIWEAPPPAWLDLARPDLWGTIAILDYGRESFVFEDRRRVPLGCNLGVRREVIEAAGAFRADLGRTSGKMVLGQEVPEWLARTRAAGFRGRYVPEMVIHHHVPASRLTKRYFRRWWVGKGYSRAMLDLMQPITDQGLDLRQVPHVRGIPRFVLTDVLRDVGAYIASVMHPAPTERCRLEMRLAYTFGYLKARGLWNRAAYQTRSVLAAGVLVTAER